jgi:hypothetical protein
MKCTYLRKLYGILLALQCLSATAADITPITLPQELLVSATTPYTLDLDREVITPNDNFLSQDHALRFTVGATDSTTDNLFVRIVFSKEVAFAMDDAVLLFEEGYQPNLATGSQDLNGDGRLEVIEIGRLVNINPSQDVLVFSLNVQPNAQANLLLSSANPDYATENGYITNTAAHPILSIRDTSQPATVSYSVHTTESDAQNGTNALFTEADILLIDFIQQFDFTITQPATSVLDASTNPANSLFIYEGDTLMSDSDTDITTSVASYLFVNNAELIDDPINLESSDFLILNVFGNMNTVSDVFEFDDSGLVNFGTQSQFTISPQVATLELTGDTFPSTIREDRIAIEIPGGQSIQPNSYDVNAQLFRDSNIMMNETFADAFNFIEQQLPIFTSQPLANSNIEMISTFGTSTSSKITFTNKGLSPLDIQLISQPFGEFEFVSSYSTQLAAGQSEQFSVQCTPSSIAGTQLNLQFTTNSPRQELINYNLECRTERQLKPEIEITVDGILIESNVNEIDFGTVYQGESSRVKMTILNIGNSTLTLDEPTVPTGFSISQTLPKQLASIVQDAQNYTTSFDLILTGNVLGEFKPVLSISNSDTDENPYQITLKGHVISKPITEQPVEPNEPVTEMPITSILPTITTGSTLSGAANNAGHIAQDITIQSNGSISGGSLAGTIDNQGLIANLTVNPDTTVDGGKISSVVYNFGTICNATVTNYSELIGGNVCDNIQNFGTLTDVNVLEGTEVTGGTLSNVIFNRGSLCDVELEDNTRIIGGRIKCHLTGQARAPATIAQAEILPDSQLRNVCITPSVTFAEGVNLRGRIQLPKSYEYPDMPDYCIVPEQISSYTDRDLLGVDPEALSIFLDADLKQIPVDAMPALTAEQMSFIPDKTLDALSVEQFDAISLNSFAGLTEDNMDGFTGHLIGHFTPDHIAAMNPQAIENVNEWGATKFITNFDPEQMPLETAQVFLKSDWSMDENGLLTVPANTPINLASFTLPETFPQQVSIDYDFPNFATGFGFGGRGTPILQQMNAALAANNPQNIQSIRQREDGLIIMRDSDGLQRAFIPDLTGQIQLDTDAPIGVTLETETGKLLVTTSAKQQFSFIPAPKDYFLLGDLLGEGNTARCYDKGDVLLQLNKNGVVVTFGAEVSRDTGDAGVYLPDDNSETTRRNSRAPIREGRVVFSDGTAQNIYPAVLFPDTFINLANQIQGVENVILNVDGTFNLTFLGQSYTLLPTFDTTTRNLSPGERIPSTLSSNPDGSIAYRVQDGDLLVITRIVISGN